ncbi:MAG TPA: DUF3732 domain-containing protein [Longimicrobium sp.]|nr:DUF3732 domain-containing protein [Longimicrobium sp.]
MMRWQLLQVLFYSHHDERRVIEFEREQVNIITGVSNSGKSAVVEVIDYCLGASRCHIPGIVREASAWVGVLWSNGRMEVLICRKVPPPDQFSSDDVYFDAGEKLHVPDAASELRGISNRNTALRRFEQIIHMGDVVGETYGTERVPTRVSFRNVLPYLLQSDDVIINKMTLLRGAGDERRQSIIDSLPYFLGITNEDTLAAEMELRRLRALKEREEKRRASAIRQLDESDLIERALIREAAQVGIISSVVERSSLEAREEQLRLAASYLPNTGQASAPTDQLGLLQEREREIRSTIASLRNQLRAADEMMDSADNFEASAKSQERKLEVVTFFRNQETADTCPVCENPLHRRTPTLNAIDAAYRQIRSELGQLDRDRPQLERFASSTRSQIDAASEELTAIRREVTSLLRESSNAGERLELEQRRSRVVGRISFYLENKERNATVQKDVDLRPLDFRITELEELVDAEAKEERIRSAERYISRQASSILAELPFEEHYRGSEVEFGIRSLRVTVVTETRPIEMRDIGSDENYLSLHVSIMLALHRWFASRERPVPGFLLFDQLSRPFFPPDKVPEEVVLTEGSSGEPQTGSDYERSRLKSYFDMLFREAETHRLQVIVLEHAYFADDERYTAATKVRLSTTDKLIPESWPRIAVEGGSK